MKKVAYIKYWDWGCPEYTLLKPTGRYKEVHTTSGKDVMYVEHKSFPFNQWIHEDTIVFRGERREATFTCSKK